MFALSDTRVVIRFRPADAKEDMTPVLRRLFLTVACALLPLAAFGQNVLAFGPNVLDPDGCIVGFPCTARLLQPPDNPAYRVQGYDCAVDQREPCRWHNDPDTGSGNVYQTRRNADGTTDVSGSNAKTGSKWNQHYDPNRGVQSGHGKNGQQWTGRLAPPFGTAPRSFRSGSDERVDLGSELNQTTEAEQQTTRDEAARELAEQQQEWERERQREAAINFGHVMSRMQPGVLAGAAKAAARQRCFGLTDVNARDACLRAADPK
jgi:hypothetical protein